MEIISYLTSFSYYIRLITTLGFLLYFYNFFYKNCNQQYKVTKNNKTKKVVKSRILLSFTYFCLILMFYFNFTYKVFLFVVSIVSMLSLLFMEKYSFNNDSLIYQFDKIKVVRIFWKFFSTVVKILLLSYQPLFEIIDNKVENYQNNVKNIYTKVMDGEDSNEKRLFNNIINLNESTSTSKSNEDDEKDNLISSFSDYIFKSSKNSKKINILNEENEKVQNEDEKDEKDDKDDEDEREDEEEKENKLKEKIDEYKDLSKNINDNDSPVEDLNSTEAN
jgi:hypothetical protein